MVLPRTVHAAFDKAAHYFGVKARYVDVGPDFRADVRAMERACDRNTILIVGSAPQYPHGVVDPIEELGELALRRKIPLHIDACFGGFMLPWLEKLGHPVPLWDFRVPGVTSISADIHKLGYAPKGVSVILHRSKALRRYQTFVFEDWLGGFYASPNLQGSRSGMPMATAWAVMQHLGLEGYLELTRVTLENADRMRAAIAGIDGIRVLGDSRFHLVALASDPSSPRPVDVFALGDALLERGCPVLKSAGISG